MDITTLTQLIGSLGFPIVACGYLAFTLNKTVKENSDATNNLATLINRLIERGKNDE